MSGLATKRATGEWVEGMDSCIRGLRIALRLAETRVDEDGERDVSYLSNEVDAIAEHWERVRGPIPEEEA